MLNKIFKAVAKAAIYASLFVEMYGISCIITGSVLMLILSCVLQFGHLPKVFASYPLACYFTAAVPLAVVFFVKTIAKTRSLSHNTEQ